MRAIRATLGAHITIIRNKEYQSWVYNNNLHTTGKEILCVYTIKKMM